MAGLQEYADLIAISGGEPYKARAYEKAARSVDGYAADIDALDDDGLLGIPNVGRSIAGKVHQLLEHGSFDELDDLRGRIPAGRRPARLHQRPGGRSTLALAYASRLPALRRRRRVQNGEPPGAGVETVKEIYRAAWRSRLKGITVYRYGSRPQQVLTFLSDTPGGAAPSVEVDAEYGGGCAGYVCEL